MLFFCGETGQFMFFHADILKKRLWKTFLSFLGVFVGDEVWDNHDDWWKS